MVAELERELSNKKDKFPATNSIFNEIKDAQSQQAYLKAIDEKALETLVSKSLKQMELAEQIDEEIKALEGIKTTTPCKMNLCKT